MLRRLDNPPNPYDRFSYDWLGEPPTTEVQVYEEHATSILSRNDSPDLGFRFSVNPYRGCFHGCAYCYARPTHEYLGFGAGSDFESKIVVKTNAAELLRQEFLKPSWKGELIFFSGVTDCYQPQEAVWELTRKCLEVCLEFRNPVSIVTKSYLIVRDLDLLKELHQEAFADVHFSIPFSRDDIAKKIEPNAPSITKRFEALEKLSQAGIPTGVLIAPLIPGLNEQDMPEILKRASACGAKNAGWVLLRLPGSVKDVFLKRIKEQFPDRAEKIINRIKSVRGGVLYNSEFFERQRGKGHYWKIVEEMFRVYQKRYGLDQEVDYLTSTTFRVPTRQVELALSA